MDANRAAVCALFGVAAVIAIFWATNKTPGNSLPIPEVQAEGQVLGVGVGAQLGYMPAAHGRTNKNTPMDKSPEMHFWAPGFSIAAQLEENHPVVRNRHCYPAISGGNVSTVMHRGWSAFTCAAPANNDWRINPPEVAVL